jgi:hypothetical protein
MAPRPFDVDERRIALERAAARYASLIDALMTVSRIEVTVLYFVVVGRLGEARAYLRALCYRITKKMRRMRKRSMAELE